MSSPPSEPEAPEPKQPPEAAEPKPAAEEETYVVPEPKPSVFKRYRWVLVIVLFVALWVIGHVTGLKDELDAETIRNTIEGAGIGGVLIFLGAFAAGELLHVPGLVFVAAAMFAYGRVEGAAISLLGAIVSVTVSFVVVRTVGGQPLKGFKRPLFRRIFSHLEERPIAVVALLRLVLWMAPALNYALAMSSLRFRHYIIGSSLGLVIPVMISAVFFDWLFR